MPDAVERAIREAHALSKNIGVDAGHNYRVILLIHYAEAIDRLVALVRLEQADVCLAEAFNANRHNKSSLDALHKERDRLRAEAERLAELE